MSDERYSALAEPSCIILGTLNAALDGHGNTTIKATSKGLSIALNGKVIAAGKTPTELLTAFKAARDIVEARLKAQKEGAQ